MTYFSQMAGLAVQNFVSAAVGIVVVVALIRGIAARAAATRARQLLAGPGPHAALRAAADLDRRRARPRLPGRDPELLGYATAHTLAGGTQTLALGPVASQEVDQGARHQRRRLLQRQLGDPVREPDRAHELRRAAADPGHPGRRSPTPTGAWSAAAARAGRSSSAMVVAVRRRRRRRLRRRAARHAGPARSPASAPTTSTARPAATWRARSSASASPTPRCGRRSRPSPRAARSTPRSSR